MFLKQNSVYDRYPSDWLMKYNKNDDQTQCCEIQNSFSSYGTHYYWSQATEQPHKYRNERILTKSEV